MGQLTIVGLGPGAWDHLTLEAQEVLSGAKEVYLRTRQHPTVAGLPPTLVVHSFDYLYRRGRSFDQVYAAIADRVLALAKRPAGLIYAVPGHPLVGEESVRRILPLAREAEIPVRLVPGLSFLDAVVTALQVDPLEAGLQVADATAVAAAFDVAGPDGQPSPSRDPFAGSYRPFDPTRPALLCQVYGARLASALKLVLLDMYPARHPTTLVRAAGVAGEEKVWTVPLYELDRQPDIDHLTSVYLPALPPLQDLRGFEDFRRIVARLRAPGGCPWDREQTHESLRRYVIEEAYEVVDALDEGDLGKLAEELGDLLLQVVLHAQLAVEHDEFTMEDVIEGIAAKLIRRHPHVFGDRTVKDSDEVLRNWDQIKRAERAEAGQETSTLASVPKALPALERAQTLQRRAARTGFDWKGVEPALAKVREEMAELAAAQSEEERQAEFGDLLFALVGVGRHLGVDAEEALRLASQRFVRRFEQMDRLRRERGLEYEQIAPADLVRLWDEARAAR